MAWREWCGACRLIAGTLCREMPPVPSKEWVDLLPSCVTSVTESGGVVQVTFDCGGHTVQCKKKYTKELNQRSLVLAALGQKLVDEYDIRDDRAISTSAHDARPQSSGKRAASPGPSSARSRESTPAAELHGRSPPRKLAGTGGRLTIVESLKRRAELERDRADSAESRAQSSTMERAREMMEYSMIADKDAELERLRPEVERLRAEIERLRARSKDARATSAELESRNLSAARAAEHEQRRDAKVVRAHAERCRANSCRLTHLRIVCARRPKGTVKPQMHGQRCSNPGL